MAYSVELDSVACIGCAACTRCEFIEMHHDMKAHVMQDIFLEIDCVRDMAEDCPVGAITYIRVSPDKQAD